jgi:hypothetical protein
MRTRLLLALTAVFAIAIASSASALLGTNTNLTTKAAAPSSSSGGNGSTSGIHDTRTQVVYDCGDQDSDQAGRTITYNGPQDIWPPNHKMRNYSITADQHQSGNVMLTTLVESSQVANGPGDGNTPVDDDTATSSGMDSGDGSATHNGWVRGERSGLDKAGRTYTFHETAMWSDGKSCSHDFSAHVPHDQSGHTNSGPKN